MHEFVCIMISLTVFLTSIQAWATPIEEMARGYEFSEGPTDVDQNDFFLLTSIASFESGIRYFGPVDLKPTTQAPPQSYLLEGQGNFCLKRFRLCANFLYGTGISGAQSTEIGGGIKVLLFKQKFKVGSPNSNFTLTMGFALVGDALSYTVPSSSVSIPSLIYRAGVGVVTEIGRSPFNFDLTVLVSDISGGFMLAPVLGFGVGL